MSFQKKLIESGIKKITRKIINEDAQSTLWAVKNINDFIAANEASFADHAKSGEPYQPKMKLFGDVDSKFFSITIEQLRAISSLLLRLNRGAKK